MINGKKIIFILCLFFSCISSTLVFADEDFDGYIVTFKENILTQATRDGTFNLYSAIPDLQPVRSDKNIFKVDSPEAVSAYMQLGLIEAIQPDYYMELFDVPTDPDYSKQWNLSMISAPAAWDIGCYGNTVKIGIIDSGIYAHEDLTETLSGGYNYVSGADKTAYMDDYGHGTYVAGIIGATFNDKNIAGIAPQCRIYSLKCTVRNSVYTSAVVAAVYGGVDDYGCTVINMSLGGSSSPSLKTAIDYAVDHNVIICAATGNAGTATSTVDGLQYPAAYSNVVGVGAVTSTSAHAYYSNKNESVWISAPGSNINSLTMPNALLTSKSGTSFACPHVSAVAAIAQNIKPDITPAEFMSLLQNTSDDLGTPGYDITFGYGLLNINNIVNTLLSDTQLFISPAKPEADGQISCVLYNNTPANTKYLTLWKETAGDTLTTHRQSNICTLVPYIGQKIFFRPQWTQSCISLIDTTSLKPIQKKFFELG